MVDLRRSVFVTLLAGAIASAVMLVVGFLTSPSLLVAGAVVLMITPMVRVLIAGICMLSKKEYVYFAMAAYVLFILVITIVVRL